MALAALPIAMEGLTAAQAAYPVAKKIFSVLHNKSSRKSLAHVINKENIKKVGKFLSSSDSSKLLSSANKAVQMAEGITGKNTITKGLSTGIGMAQTGLKHYHNLLEKYSGGRKMIRDHFGF